MRIRSLVLTVAMLLVVGACGGDPGGNTQPTTPPDIAGDVDETVDSVIPGDESATPVTVPRGPEFADARDLADLIPDLEQGADDLRDLIGQLRGAMDRWTRDARFDVAEVIAVFGDLSPNWQVTPPQLGAMLAVIGVDVDLDADGFAELLAPFASVEPFDDGDMQSLFGALGDSQEYDWDWPAAPDLGGFSIHSTTGLSDLLDPDFVYDEGVIITALDSLVEHPGIPVDDLGPIIYWPVAPLSFDDVTAMADAANIPGFSRSDAERMLLFTDGVGEACCQSIPADLGAGVADVAGTVTDIQSLVGPLGDSYEYEWDWPAAPDLGVASASLEAASADLVAARDRSAIGAALDDAGLQVATLEDTIDRIRNRLRDLYGTIQVESCGDYPDPGIGSMGSLLDVMEPIDVQRAVIEQWGVDARISWTGRHLYDWRAVVDGDEQPIDLERAVDSQWGPGYTLVMIGSHRCDWAAVDLGALSPTVVPVMLIASDEFEDVDSTDRGFAQFESLMGYVQTWYAQQVGETFHLTEAIGVPTGLDAAGWNLLSEMSDWERQQGQVLWVADRDACYSNPTAEDCAVPGLGEGTSTRYALLDAAAYWAERGGIPPASNLKIALSPYAGDAADMWLGGGGYSGGIYAIAPQRATSLDCSTAESISEGCSNAGYAMGHELGHTFGLGHTCEQWPGTDPCSTHSLMETGWPSQCEDGIGCLHGATLEQYEIDDLLESPFFYSIPISMDPNDLRQDPPINTEPAEFGTDDVSLYTIGDGWFFLEDVSVEVLADPSRVVFRFTGDGAPAVDAGYSDAPFNKPDGTPVMPPGNAHILLRIHPSGRYDCTQSPCEQVYFGPLELLGDELPIASVVFIEDMEEMYWAVGLKTESPFRVLQATNPARLIIEFEDLFE